MNNKEKQVGGHKPDKYKVDRLPYYIELLAPHKEQLTSTRKWNNYRTHHDLPHSQTLIRQFGSWNEVKEALDIKEVNERHRPIKYDADKVRAVLKEHGEHLKSMQQWNAHATEHHLPNYAVLFDRLSEDEVFELTGYRKTFNQETLSQVIKKHFPDSAPTIRRWEELANTDSNIPSASLIILHFGSWKKMKRKVYDPLTEA